MLTITSNSLTVTSPSPPQSPTQVGSGVGVAEGVAVSVPNSVPVGVSGTVGVAVRVVGGTPPVCVGVALADDVAAGEAGAVGVDVLRGVSVCVAVGVAGAADSATDQKPPLMTKVPPLSVPASGWPMVPLNSYAPPVAFVPPPPSMVFQCKSYPPPVCARAGTPKTSTTSASTLLRDRCGRGFMYRAGWGRPIGGVATRRKACVIVSSVRCAWCPAIFMPFPPQLQTIVYTAYCTCACATASFARSTDREAGIPASTG